MASRQDRTHSCWICGDDVSLEKCKIDEHGKAVHEDCYAARFTCRTAIPRKVPTPLRVSVLINFLLALHTRRWLCGGIV